MLNTQRAARQAGFTLVELMVTVSIGAILASVATPSFTSFIRNTEVRGSSESLTQGLQFARTEAVRRNQQVCFDWSGTGTGWTVSTGCAVAPGSVPAANIIQSSPNREGSLVTIVTMTPSGGQRVTFNGFGRVIPNPAGGASITRIDITATSARMTRRILVSAGDSSGRIFVCDPAAAAGSQMACS
ncbi:MAG: GspH/FimT family pseudopilin [Burkholderiaceae bacterium]